MNITLNTNDNALTETRDNVPVPVDFSFDKVNDFVHSTETTYEDLKGLCLAMVNRIDELEKTIAYIEKTLCMQDSNINW